MGNELDGLELQFLAALPQREQVVVREYVTDRRGNKTRAMLAAGYARSTAYKQQWRMFSRPRIRRALIEIKYKQDGPEWMSNEELRGIGVNVRSLRQKERRVREREREIGMAWASAEVARILAKRRK